MSGDVPPKDHLLRALLERHGITDASQFLIDHKDVPIDRTLRINGVPIVSSEEVERRMRKLRFL